MQNGITRELRSSARLVGPLILGMAFISIGCGQEDVPSVGRGQYAATTWFGNLTQSQRNSYITSTAYSYYGATNQCNCKEWARTVVKGASSNQADIPSTMPNGWQWYMPDQNARSINYIPYQYPIYAAVPGNIVQMVYGSNTHTAIIWSKDSTNVCFIDANWVASCTVGTHCQSLSSFVSNAPNHSVYEVTGH